MLSDDTVGGEWAASWWLCDSGVKRGVAVMVLKAATSSLE